ncbi:hypothetical protein BWQ96_06596 [Gracilariopsis chorda]|uniref:Uncharacterized protein n=1 Tax=Gracilariopsis chorda TaxID=448386 RepID=A0A2V3INK4_9FLOR|nr:hypothetical protein BWQ96_06596 [Gracilariopsis chorda]|eukprot:PXF43637.1 hypothetical protein BWQ96_06596 [Gracilariopsis chorda]
MDLYAAVILVFLLTASSVHAVSVSLASVRGNFLPRIPIRTQRTRMEPCSIVNSHPAVGSFSESFETFSVLTTCATNNDGFITHFAGNYSLESSALVCDESPLISYNYSGSTNRTLDNNPALCGPDTCVVVFSESDTVSLSAAIRKDEVETLRNQSISIPFIETKVFFEFDGLLEEFAMNLLEAYSKAVTDSLVLRSKTLLGAKSDLCPFPERNSCVCRS